MLNALEAGQPINVGERYAKRRRDLGYPYPGDTWTEVEVSPDSLNIEGSNSVIFLSVGGNDVVLARNTNVKEIIENITTITSIYTAAGARVVYILPYPPTRDMSSLAALDVLYEQIKKQVADSGLDYISLADFGDEFRKDPGSGIPEPTPAGAQELASRIAKKYLELRHASSSGWRPREECPKCGETLDHEATCSTRCGWSERTGEYKLDQSKTLYTFK